MGLTSLIQESLLVLLMFDKENGGRVCSLVPKDAWDNIYGQLASRAVDYWSKYREPPGEQALDLFADLAKSNTKIAEQVENIWRSLLEVRDGINPKYVLDQVSGFIREQRFRTGIIESVELLEAGKLADAEALMLQSMNGVLDVFDPGLLFHEMDVAELLTNTNQQALYTGVRLLDERQLGPTPGELHLFIAPPGYGKSWWLLHLAKLCVANRKRAVYISLEMSEKRIASRLLQTFFSVSKRKEAIVNKFFDENELGQLIGISEQEPDELRSFADDDIIPTLTKLLSGFGRRSPLVIKQFPTGQLTVRELNAYLDSLEMSRRIVPDLVIVDYADLMSVGSRDFRHELGNLYKDLRGLAVKRNVALATASQANRLSLDSKLVTRQSVAEDYSKIATSDVVLTYSQTEAEFNLGTARLFVDKGRNDTDKFTILITQNYRTGQFCLSSTRMSERPYWDAVNREKVSTQPKRRRQL